MFKSIKYPLAALEIGEGYASGVKLEKRSGKPVVSDFITVELPFKQTPTEGQAWNNYKLDERFQEGVDEIIQWLGKEKAASLALPDMATRSFVVTLENESGNPREMRDLILFKVQKFAPVSTEGTTLDYLRLPAAPGQRGRDFLVLLSSKAIIASYEKYFQQRGIHIGNVETASLASLVLFSNGSSSPLEGAGNFVLCRMERSHFTLTVFNNFNLVFMRTRVLNEEASAAFRVVKEIKTLRLFVEDRLGARAYDTAFFYGPGEYLEDSFNQTAAAGFHSVMLSLEQFADLPNELHQYEHLQGRFYAATSAAARSVR